MTRARRFFLANAMMLANTLANLVALGAAAATASHLFPDLKDRIHAAFETMGPWWDTGTFLVAFLVIYSFELPFRRVVWKLKHGQAITPDNWELARRRLLNAPVFMIVVDTVIWLASAVWVNLICRLDPGTAKLTVPLTLQTLATGLVAVIAAFFLVEQVSQRKLAPVFFPKGGQSNVTKVVRIKLGYRLLAFFLAATVIPLGMMLLMVKGASRILDMGLYPAEVILGQLLQVTRVSFGIFLLSGLILLILVKSNLTRNLRNMTHALSGIRKGDFDQRVRVLSNDELAYAGDVINQMAEGLKEREFIKDVFGRYVAKEVAEEILAGRIPLDGEMKEVTVLFADIRDFTPLTESHPPKEVVKLINSYFERMSRAIEQQGGLVLQFIGDEIEAVFGAPSPKPDHPERALKAAVTMRESLAQLNQELSAAGQPNIRHGIGIHTGPALAANIGSSQRHTYSLVGDTVNLASRLQNLNKVYQTEIILSEATRCRLGQETLKATIIRELPPTPIKGKTEHIMIHTVA